MDAGFHSRYARVEVVDMRPQPTAGVKPLRTDGRGSRYSKANPVVFPTESAEGAVRETKIAVLETEIRTTNRSEAQFSEGNTKSEPVRRIDAEAVSDIVRHVKVVLNRADAGEIRINLRPEHLGRIRVRIQMEENRLSGRIFVESAAAREAFRSALDGLQAKFCGERFRWPRISIWPGTRETRRIPEGMNASGGDAGNREAALNEFESMSAGVVEEIGPDGRINMFI